MCCTDMSSDRVNQNFSPFVALTHGFEPITWFSQNEDVSGIRTINLCRSHTIQTLYPLDVSEQRDM